MRLLAVLSFGSLRSPANRWGEQIRSPSIPPGVLTAERGASCPNKRATKHVFTESANRTLGAEPRLRHCELNSRPFRPWRLRRKFNATRACSFGQTEVTQWTGDITARANACAITAHVTAFRLRMSTRRGPIGTTGVRHESVTGRLLQATCEVIGHL